MAYFISAENHRRTLREQQGGHHVAHALPAQCIDRFVVRLAFYTHIGAVISAVTIAVFLAVSLVVFVFVANEITQREAIVAGDEIDACPGFSVVVLKHIARTVQ